MGIAERKWVREEVVILVTEYFRTKQWTREQLNANYLKISDFLRKREESLTGQPVSETFRNFAGIHMQTGRIQSIDPDTKYTGMQGTKLQKEIVQEYLLNPQKLIKEADEIYEKYK